MGTPDTKQGFMSCLRVYEMVAHDGPALMTINGDLLIRLMLDLFRTLTRQSVINHSYFQFGLTVPLLPAAFVELVQFASSLRM